MLQPFYEDGALFVINKPPGLECAPGNFSGLWLCHRLDKGTSGVLILAKSEKVRDRVQEQFKRRVVEKIYRVLVHGTPVPAQGVVDQSIARVSGVGKFGITGESDQGRAAYTEYKTLEVLQSVLSDHKFRSYAGLEVYPRTGRTHQIRVHFKSLGHSVVGDQLYASARERREDQMIPCPRQFLHALSIKVTHPETGAALCFRADLAEDLERVLEKLRAKAVVTRNFS